MKKDDIPSHVRRYKRNRTGDKMKEKEVRIQHITNEITFLT